MQKIRQKRKQQEKNKIENDNEKRKQITSIIKGHIF